MTVTEIISGLLILCYLSVTNFSKNKMSFNKISLKNVNGIESDKLLFTSKNIKNKQKILNNLNNILPPNSDKWQSIQKNGRSRIVIGPRGTGLIGGRGNKVVPSIPWENSEWAIIRNFVKLKVKQLETKNILPKNLVPTVLINYYPNGSSGIIYHQDRTDNCLGTIVSFTFGPKNMARNFLIRNIHTGNEAYVTLKNGDSLIMTGTFNENFQHAVETMKKKDIGWDLYRYNITLRFVCDPKLKIRKTKITNYNKQDNGVLNFKKIVKSYHPLSEIKFIPTSQIENYSQKYLIRFKNWGNVGDFKSDKSEILELVQKKQSEKVQNLPDFYIYLPTKKAFEYIVYVLESLQKYFRWKYPRESRFKVGKIDLVPFIDILFNFRKRGTLFTIPDIYNSSIVNITPKTNKTKVVTKRYGFYVSEHCRIKKTSPGTKGIIWAKNCQIKIDGKMSIVPGLNLQYPYAAWLVDGKKTIETRTWKINENLLNKYIAIIETPGKMGKKHGVEKAQIIGYVKFKATREYLDNDSWLRDQEYHCCDFNLNGTII